MKYIISGEDKELGKVIRENSIRVARGLIKFEPVPAESSEDTKEPVDDTKDTKTPVDDTKEPTEDSKEPTEDIKEPEIDAKEPTSDVKAQRKNKK